MKRSSDVLLRLNNHNYLVLYTRYSTLSANILTLVYGIRFGIAQTVISILILRRESAISLTYSSFVEDPPACPTHRKCGRGRIPLAGTFPAGIPDPTLGMRCRYAAARNNGADSHPIASHSALESFFVPALLMGLVRANSSCSGAVTLVLLSNPTPPDGAFDAPLL